jgi:transposase
MRGSHEPLLLNYYRAKRQLGSGIVEGFSTKLKLVTRSSYGFRSAETCEIALYHAVRQLPTPALAHPSACEEAFFRGGQAHSRSGLP